MKDYCLVLSIRKKLKLSGWLMITTDHQHSLRWLIIVICTQTWFCIYSYGHWSHLDCSQQVLGRVVDPWDDITEALGVGSPQNNDFVHTTGLTEVSYVCCNSLHLEDHVLFETNCKRKKVDRWIKRGVRGFYYLLRHGASEDIVCATLLICSNELWNVDWWSGFQAAHVWLQLLL